MIFDFDTACADLRSWLVAKPEAQKKFPMPSEGDCGRAVSYGRAWSREWTNEMHFAWCMLSELAASNWNGRSKEVYIQVFTSFETWVGGGILKPYSADYSWNAEMPSTLEALRLSKIPFIEFSNGEKTFYLALVKNSGAGLGGYGMVTTGEIAQSGYLAGRLYWYPLRRFSENVWDDFRLLCKKRYASMYRLACKSRPKQVRPTVVNKAITFQTDQMALLSDLATFQADFNRFKKEIEDGNMNAKGIAQLYDTFGRMQERITETRTKHKRFIGKTVEETTVRVEEALSGTE